MITIVCFVCVLFISCRCQRILDEGHLRLSPYGIIPEKQMRIKTGTPITLKCHKGSTIWEYKPCHSNSYGLCDFENENGNWSKLNLSKSRITFDSAQKNNSGIYKCSDKHVAKKIFIVDVVPPGYDGPPPNVAPLKISNLTGQCNMEFTIQCNVTSEVPPTIFWFKSCYGQKCDIKYKKVCYCHINTSISYYNMDKIYLSKFSIFNARDVDSGVYACLAITQYGENSENVTITVPSSKVKEENELFSLLFLIPFTLILALLAVWLYYYRRKKKSVIIIVDQQKQLIRPVVRINREANEII